MNATRKIALIALASLAILLTGCASNTMAEAKAIPNSVVETKNASFASQSTFGYVDAEGQIQPLSDCGRPGAFEQRYCKSEGGLVTFTYSTHKGRVRHAAVEVDGVKQELFCTVDGDDSWSGIYICIPTE